MHKHEINKIIIMFSHARVSCVLIGAPIKMFSTVKTGPSVLAILVMALLK